MKKLFTTAMAVLALGSMAQAQQGGVNYPYISEFLYNDPSAPDSLEFIELYNPYSFTDLNITGFTLSGAVTKTFAPGTIVPSMGYLVIAKDSAAILRNFGIAAMQWDTAQGLNNTGETIILRDFFTTVADSVNYSAAAGWTLVSNAQGYSLELCDPTDRLLYSSWLPASTGTGVVINGTEVLATPGAANACVAPVYPVYPIATVTSNDANGAADSLGVTCELRAVVHSEDFVGTAAIQFAFIDHTNTGLRVYASTALGGYVPMRGDSLHIQGTISQFNGATELTADAITVISSGNGLVTPMDVMGAFDENIEGRLIRINNVTVVDTPSSTAAGMTVRFTDGTNTYDVRIDADTDAFNHNFGTNEFGSIVGIGGQFDPNSPYDSGYQLMPRDIADFDALVNTVKVNGNNGFQAVAFPNPTTGMTTIQANAEVLQVLVTDMLGRQVEAFQPMQSVFQLEANWGAGLYNVTIVSANGSTTQRLVVR